MASASGIRASLRVIVPAGNGLRATARGRRVRALGGSRAPGGKGIIAALATNEAARDVDFTLLELIRTGGWLMVPIGPCRVAALGICLEAAREPGLTHVHVLTETRPPGPDDEADDG